MLDLTYYCKNLNVRIFHDNKNYDNLNRRHLPEFYGMASVSI